MGLERRLAAPGSPPSWGPALSGSYQNAQAAHMTHDIAKMVEHCYSTAVTLRHSMPVPATCPQSRAMRVGLCNPAMVPEQKSNRQDKQ